MIWRTQWSICILKQVDHFKFPIQIKTEDKLWQPFLYRFLLLFPPKKYFFGAGRKNKKAGKNYLRWSFCCPRMEYTGVPSRPPLVTLGLIEYFGPGLHSFLKSERKSLQKINSSTSGYALCLNARKAVHGETSYRKLKNKNPRTIFSLQLLTWVETLSKWICWVHVFCVVVASEAHGGREAISARSGPYNNLDRS